MRKNGGLGIFLVKPKYGLTVLLGLCVVTVVVSLYFLDDLTLKVPDRVLVPLLEKEVIGGHYDQQVKVKGHMPAPVILNDIEIEVFNTSNKLEEVHEGDELKNISRNMHFISALEKNDVNDVQQLNPQREKYIIYYCHKNITCCGWGDRQHGILSAYVISLVTNRTFGVDMSAPCHLSNLLHPRKLNWKINTTLLQGLPTKHIYAVNDKVFRQFMAQINFNAVYPQDVVYLTTNYDYFYALKNNPHYKTIFRQKLKTKPRPIVFADLWQSIFKLNRRVKRKVTNAIERARPTKDYKLVCAHLRFGKNPTFPWDSEIRNTMDSVSVLWEFFQVYKDPRKYKIFIASDSEGVRAKARELFPLQNIEIEGEIIHIDKSRRMKTDACQGFEKVLADQYFLSTCDVLVLTYSVFGKGAAYMRRSNDNLYFLEEGQIKPLKLFNEKLLQQNSQT